MNADIDRYKSYCKVLGYMSNIQSYEDSYRIVMQELSAFQISILHRHSRSLPADMVRKLVVPIHRNRWYAKGQRNYSSIRSKLVNSFRKKIEHAVEHIEHHPNGSDVAMLQDPSYRDSNHYKSLEAIVLNIIAMDTFYGLYEDVIDYIADRNHTFRHLMHSHFGEHMFI